MRRGSQSSIATQLIGVRHSVETLTDLTHLASQLAASVRPGDHLGLLGPLGAGKTTFIQAFASTLGAQEVPASPTFTLRNVIRLSENSKIRRLVHVDLYRLRGRQAIDELGLADDLAALGTIVAIEWADRAPVLIRQLRYLLEFSWDMTTDRRTLLIRDTHSSAPFYHGPLGS